MELSLFSAKSNEVYANHQVPAEIAAFFLKLGFVDMMAAPIYTSAKDSSGASEVNAALSRSLLSELFKPKEGDEVQEEDESTPDEAEDYTNYMVLGYNPVTNNLLTLEYSILDNERFSMADLIELLNTRWGDSFEQIYADTVNPVRNCSITLTLFDNEVIEDINKSKKRNAYTGCRLMVAAYTMARYINSSILALSHADVMRMILNINSVIRSVPATLQHFYKHDNFND